jgi:hypothetical protein
MVNIHLSWHPAEDSTPNQAEFQSVQRQKIRDSFEQERVMVEIAIIAGQFQLGGSALNCLRLLYPTERAELLYLGPSH